MRKIGEAYVAYGLFEAYRMEIGRRRRKGKKATGSPPVAFCVLFMVHPVSYHGIIHDNEVQRICRISELVSDNFIKHTTVML